MTEIVCGCLIALGISTIINGLVKFISNLKQKEEK